MSENERLARVEEQVKGVREDVSELKTDIKDFKSESNSRFNGISKQLVNLETHSSLSGKDKVLLISSLIGAGAAIVVALVK